MQKDFCSRNFKIEIFRWSKPHVGTLSIHAFFQLEKHLKSDGVFLDCEAESITEVTDVILKYLEDVTMIDEAGLNEVETGLNAKNHHHSKQKARAHMGQKIPEGAEGRV